MLIIRIDQMVRVRETGVMQNTPGLRGTSDGRCGCTSD